MLRIPKIVKKTNAEIFGHFRNCRNTSYELQDEQVNFLFESDLYSVSLNGIPAPVRGCRESAIPFNRFWPGKQRDLSQTELSAFVTFSSDEPVTLKVKPKNDFDKVYVKPVSKNIIPETENGEIIFTLKDAGCYVLEPGSSHEVLYVFFNEPKEYPDAESATHYFGPGLHFPGVINLRDGDSVYIDEEAIVFGSINSLGAKNVRIFGGGILDNSCEERVIEHCYENSTKGTFRIYNCHNVCVEDIILLNSSTWVMSMFYCNDVIVDNIKIIGQWRYNTDGIDIVNTSNVVIKNSFIRSFDDSVTIKGIYEYDMTIENITVENCVMWCGWGVMCRVGIESHAPEYKNIRFNNIFSIHSSSAVLAVQNAHDCDIHDIIFENIDAEFSCETLPEIYQESDDMLYNAYGKPGKAVLINITNCQLDGCCVEDDRYVRLFCKQYGKNRNIYFNNIRVYTDSESVRPEIFINSEDKSVPVENVFLNNIYVNGAKQENLDKFETVFENFINIKKDGRSI